MDNGTVYEIRFKDCLNPIWGERFADMTLEYDAARHETVFRGRVTDQSALYGLLMQARNLALTLVSVNPIAYRGEEK